MQERRKSPRTKINKLLDVVDLDRDIVLGRLVDLSPEGFMLLSERSLEVNRIFQLGLQLPPGSAGRLAALGAESLWQETSNDSRQYWVGFQIIDISQDSLDKIHQLLRQFP